MENHLQDLAAALRTFDAHAPTLARWGRELAALLDTGGRLLACGNGGSAAQAQHLTAELVGRYARERRPFAAVSLHADTSAVTAIVNDYGADEVFARQVRAHGRRGDVLVCLSTSGSSGNVVAAARAAADLGVRTWAITGPGPNPLAAACDEAVTVDAPSTCTVQEVHLAAVHMVCEAMDDAVLADEASAAAAAERGKVVAS
ncbi:D-sedoheptulose-7-phosphate isomerase [Actinomadura atramentaria]|uniref:D-sedoheptulose-7-phosphate isomerase n=1 Tax=Actinomadura atramentaria TaxID=1990 RepID=UPI00035E8EE6|nr:SIS domain-containing protein [Actinomadura atramentaria]